MVAPENVPYSVKHLAELSDEIWFLAGDNSSDLNWYSKRMLLAAVYSSTELFMTTDTSDNFENTRDFLKRRIKDVGRVGKSASNLKNIFSFGTSQLNSILQRK
jgi:ubiquinone biosynthesis protein COQ9